MSRNWSFHSTRILEGEKCKKNRQMEVLISAMGCCLWWASLDTSFVSSQVGRYSVPQLRITFRSRILVKTQEPATSKTRQWFLSVSSFKRYFRVESGKARQEHWWCLTSGFEEKWGWVYSKSSCCEILLIPRNHICQKHYVTAILGPKHLRKKA